MRYKPLGHTGLLVSELCLGTMTFGGQGFWKAMGALTIEQVQPIVQQALAAGINFIDTADVYSEGMSETLLGQALANLGVKRSEVVIATKVFGRMGPGPNDRGASRGHILNMLQSSLDRLGTDYIDLYQIHGFDALTPIDETLRVLDDVITSGMVRYIGCSNWPAWQIMKAQGISERKGWARFETLQAYYSLAGRDLEREIVPCLLDQKMGLMVWSPLAGGLLSGKYNQPAGKDAEGRRASFDFPPVDKDRAAKCVDVMRTIAASKNATVAQIALAWLLHQEVVTSIILGVKTPEQLTDNLGSATIQFSPEELAQLNAVSQLPSEYPAWMIERQGADRIPKT